MLQAIDLSTLSRLQKLKVMEDLWADLSSEPDRLESPAWHKTELAKTSKRIKAGTETFSDWDLAKSRLRKTVQ